MGLHTSYLGHVAMEPPLAWPEVEFIRSFAHTRHWDSGGSEVRIAAHPSDNEPRDDVGAYNRPAPGMPGLWCPWTVCQNGCCLHWDGAEKPYDADHWLRYLIEAFLCPGAVVTGTDVASEHGLTCDHRLNGVVVGERRETGELFSLEVVDGVVRRHILLAKRPGVDEWGYGSDESETQERHRLLAERRKRFETALAQDRRAAAG